jgi:hypothetical protein
MSTALITTHTTLDTHKLIACSLGLLKVIKSTALEEQLKELEVLIDQRKMLVPEVSTKEEYKKLFADIYTSYPQPTYCYLGDVTEIDEAAQEGMLKVLEEPPHNLTFVLSAREISLVKPTILSRSTVVTIPVEKVPSLLDQELLSESKKLLPECKLVVTELLKHSTESIREIEWKNIERVILDFWLWQLGYYTEMILVQTENHTQELLHIVKNIILAKKLNQENVQKKLVGEQLLVF